MYTAKTVDKEHNVFSSGELPRVEREVVAEKGKRYGKGKVVSSFGEYFRVMMTLLSLCSLETEIWGVNAHETRTMGKHSAKYLDGEKQIGLTQCVSSD